MFFKHVVCKFGVPDEIVSDRDRRFVSTFWQHLWKLLGTKTLMSTAFHPQTDGQTERMHRTLAQILRALLFQDQPELWAEKLPYVELAINSATNATT